MKLPSLIPKFLTPPAPHPAPPSSPPSQLKTQNSELKTSADAASPDDPTVPRSHAGKIGRLPKDIREQINRRLYDDEPVSDLLPWLNELPHVKELLAAQFAGAPINFQNLSGWRTTGYQDWLDQRQHVAKIKGLGIYSKTVVDAGRGSLSSAAATLIFGKVLKFLEAIADENSTPEELAKIAAAINPLLKAEQNILRINIAKQRLRQRDAQYLLMRDKHQRDVAAISLRVLGDARAKAIEASDCSYEQKIELIGRYLFDDLWDPRPTQPSPEYVTDAPSVTLDQPDLNPKTASTAQGESS